jgi:tRNA (mo5U34)-methyltransferase
MKTDVNENGVEREELADNQQLREQIDQNTAQSRTEMLGGSWWHSIDLGRTPGSGPITPGVHPIEELHAWYNRLDLPDDLTGRRLLDVGCWDGFYSFEAERHGAEVVSVDCWRPENYFKARAALQSPAEFHELSVYDVTRERLGTFDIVLFLGVLYHLRHPLLGLEQICEVTRDFAVVSSHIIDGFYQSAHPIMEFYEIDQLGGQYDNWWGPNVDCMTRMLRAAGFARTELLYQEETRAVIKAWRNWDDRPGEAVPSLGIVDIVNASSLDHYFPHRGQRAFISLRVTGLPADARRDELRVEIGGFGINPVYAGPWIGPYPADQFQINAPIPPGLVPGPVDVRVWHRDRESPFVRIDLVPGTQW